MRIARVTLRPHITLSAGTLEAEARDWYRTPTRQCFVANSVATAISIEPTFSFVDDAVSVGGRCLTQLAGPDAAERSRGCGTAQRAG